MWFLILVILKTTNKGVFMVKNVNLNFECRYTAKNKYYVDSKNHKLGSSDQI